MPAPFGSDHRHALTALDHEPGIVEQRLVARAQREVLGLDHDAPAALDLGEAERERAVAARRLDPRHALDRLRLRLRLARARAGAELVDEALQPLDLGLLALERVGLVRERHRLLAAVGAVAHRVVLAAPELELEDARGDALQEPAVVRDEQDRAVSAVS